MDADSRTKLDKTELGEILAGGLSPAQRAQLAERLETHPDQRAELERLGQLAEIIRQPSPQLEQIDLVERVRQARQRVSVATSDRRVSWGLRRWLTLSAVCASALLAVAALYESTTGHRWRTRPGFEEAVHGFRAKSAASGTPSPERWCALHAFAVASPARAAQPLGDHLPGDSGLLFAYTNLGPRPYSHLMIVARDAQARVHWYYPAFAQADTDPAAVPIVAGRSRVELPDLVRQALAPGPLTIYGLFLHKPLHVSQIEAMLNALPLGTDTSERLPLHDAGQIVLRTTVMR